MEPSEQGISEIIAANEAHRAAVFATNVKYGLLLVAGVLAAWAVLRFINGPGARVARFIGLWFRVKEAEMEARLKREP
jgi:hypothetical protein